MNDEQRSFVEEFGLAFERLTLPRMAGRVLGWLMISSTPHQSIDELAEALVASRASISTMTRLLIQIGIIERISLPGVRHDFFRIRHGAVQHLLRQRVKEVTVFRRLAERGLEIQGDKATPTRQWLEEMYDIYTFLERELPALLERWEQERGNRHLQPVRKGSRS